MNFSQGHSGTKVQCESCLFSQGKTRKKHQNSQKWGEIHELFVLPLSLVWFAGATPDTHKLSKQWLSRAVSEYCSACVSRVGLSTKQATEPHTTSSTILGTPPYSDEEIPVRRALRPVALLVGFSTGNPPKIETFTAWNRTRDRTRTPPDWGWPETQDPSPPPPNNPLNQGTKIEHKLFLKLFGKKSRIMSRDFRQRIESPPNRTAIWDPDCLVQGPTEFLNCPQKSIREGASSLFRGRELNINFFFWNFSGAVGISRQTPGISRPKKVWFPWFRGTYRTFGPPPLHVEDPYLNGKYPDSKVWVWVSFRVW